MLCTNIIPLVHKNQVIGLWADPDKKMIEWCLIIPIEQHHIYYHGVNAEILEKLSDHRSPKFIIDSAMSYADLRIIVEKTPAEIFIKKFHKTGNICTAFNKLQLTFLGPGFTQHHAGQLEEEIRSLKYKGEFKYNNFQMYVAGHKKIFQQLQNLNNDGYAGISPCTYVHYFLGG